MTPALTSSSLNLFISAKSSLGGSTPASLSGLPLTSTMNRIVSPWVECPYTQATNDVRGNRHGLRARFARAEKGGGMEADRFVLRTRSLLLRTAISVLLRTAISPAQNSDLACSEQRSRLLRTAISLSDKRLARL